MITTSPVTNFCAVFIAAPLPLFFLWWISLLILWIFFFRIISVPSFEPSSTTIISFFNDFSLFIFILSIIVINELLSKNLLKWKNIFSFRFYFRLYFEVKKSFKKIISWPILYFLWLAFPKAKIIFLLKLDLRFGWKR